MKTNSLIKSTHNSGTGEPSKNILHSLLTPFARCQTKTIAEQFLDGVRLFDIRVDKYDYICHGLWKSQTTIEEVIRVINIYNKHKEEVHFIVTFEGRPGAGYEQIFVEGMEDLFITRPLFDWAKLDSLNIKLPTWRTVWMSKDAWTYRQCYPKITGWKCLLPIPWFWNKIEHFTSDDTDVEMRDFI